MLEMTPRLLHLLTFILCMCLCLYWTVQWCAHQLLSTANICYPFGRTKEANEMINKWFSAVDECNQNNRCMNLLSLPLLSEISETIHLVLLAAGQVGGWAGGQAGRRNSSEFWNFLSKYLTLHFVLQRYRILRTIMYHKCTNFWGT